MDLWAGHVAIRSTLQDACSWSQKENELGLQTGSEWPPALERPLHVNRMSFWETYRRPDCRERTWPTFLGFPPRLERQLFMGIPAPNSALPVS